MTSECFLPWGTDISFVPLFSSKGSLVIEHDVMITDDEDSAQTLAVAVNKLTQFNNKTSSKLSFDNETVEVLAVHSGDDEGLLLCNLEWRK